MRSQLRSAFYLLSRSAWFKGAVVLTVLSALARVWMLSRGFSFGLQDVLLGNWYFPALICCLVPAGLAGADQKAHGWRANTASKGDRAGYLISRIVTTWVSVTVLVALALALDALLGLVVPAASLLRATPSAFSLPWILGGYLAYVAYAQIALLLCWWSGHTSATLVLLALMAPKDILFFALVQLFQWLGGFVPAFLAVAEVVGSLSLGNVFSVTVVFDMSARLVPNGPLVLFALPLGWIAATLLLSWRVMSKKAL